MFECNRSMAQTAFIDFMCDMHCQHICVPDSDGKFGLYPANQMGLDIPVLA